MLLRNNDKRVINAYICDSKNEQEIDNFIYFIEMPLISSALEAYKLGKSSFNIHNYSYEIIGIDLIKKSKQDQILEKIYIKNNAVIHLVSKKSFDGIYFCCPNCRTTNKLDIQLVSAEIERLSDQSKYFTLPGVLNCKNCDYFYVDKILFKNFLNEHNYDVLVPRKEIEIQSNKIVVSNDWHGAPDSVLSRHGYSADGTFPDHIRHQIIEYLIINNQTTYYDIQNLLSGFIHFREDRNQNAAEIWRDDLEWLHTRFGTNKNVKGIISQF